MQKKLTVLFAFAIFLLLVGWAVTPAQAHHDPGHSGGGGGKTAGTIVTTMVQWGGIITGDKARPCMASQVQQNGDSGFYTCKAGTPKVNYALGVAGDQTLRNGDKELCKVFINIDLTPDSRYGYNWSDNCSDDGTCTIVINNWFTGEQVTTAIVSFIRLRAFAQLDTVETNPFVDSLTLKVDEINLIFYAEGSNKKIAECAYRPDLGNLTKGDVTFQSVPD